MSTGAVSSRIVSVAGHSNFEEFRNSSNRFSDRRQ